MLPINDKTDFCDLVEVIDATTSLLPGAFVAFGVEKKLWCRIVCALLPVVMSLLKKICQLISKQQENE